MTARKFGKWLRRFGYLTFLVSLLWIFIYTRLFSHLFQTADRDYSLHVLYICRSISDMLAKIAIGSVIFGVIIGVTQRFAKKKECVSDIGKIDKEIIVEVQNQARDDSYCFVSTDMAQNPVKVKQQFPRLLMAA